MKSQSQKNSEDIIKLQGSLNLLDEKITTIKDNHLKHIEDKVNTIYKFLWVIATISLSSLLNFVGNLIN